jgi:hypothetical protein
MQAPVSVSHSLIGRTTSEELAAVVEDDGLRLLLLAHLILLLVVIHQRADPSSLCGLLSIDKSTIQTWARKSEKITRNKGNYFFFTFLTRFSTPVTT